MYNKPVSFFTFALLHSGASVVCANFFLHPVIRTCYRADAVVTNKDIYCVYAGV